MHARGPRALAITSSDFRFFYLPIQFLGLTPWIQPVDERQGRKSTSIGCQYIDGRQMHQVRCSFYLLFHFQNIVKNWTQSRVLRGESQARKQPQKPRARRADPSTGKRPANTCANRRRRRPRAGSPASSIRGRIRSAPKPSHASSSASCNRKQPTAPWYPQRRADWETRRTKTSRRTPNAPGTGMNPAERPA